MTSCSRQPMRWSARTDQQRGMANPGARGRGGVFQCDRRGGQRHLGFNQRSTASFRPPVVKQDLAIYPPKNALDKLFTVEELPAAVARLSTRLWTRLKTNT